MSDTTPYLHTTLPNGLKLHLKEVHTAPIISSWMWYRVGSRYETPGITGISHWVEHMQFKGTEHFPNGLMDKVISREGGVWNAMTHIDWTTYYETMPAEKIDIAFQLEADRMVNSIYDPKEVAAERTVIISEREGNENEPLFQLGEAVQGASFRVHPYHHEVIGEMADLKTMQRDDLYHHYRRYYHPANAIMAIAGDFKTDDLLTRLGDLYGGIPAGETHPLVVPVEPSHTDEQRIEVQGSGETTFLQLSYHSPQASHPDFLPLVVLDSLLTGPSSLNMFGGGGISNKTSRLYQAVVEKELAVGVHGSLQATVDPFMYDIHLTVHPARTAADTLAVVDEEINRMLDNHVTEAEIARAVKQARALFVYSSENITNQAFWMGYSEIFADYNWFLEYIQRLENVRPADVLRAAQTYLQPSNRVVGVYLPTTQKAKKARKS